MSNGNYQGRPQGKEDQPNKVKFSSVKLGQTKQGSPTIGIYLGTDKYGVNHMQKLYNLLGELLQAGEDGCKVACIVINGEKYDSGYAYVNPKEKREDNQQTQGQQTQGGNNYPRKQSGNGNFGNKDSARGFFANKRIGNN